MQNPRQIKYFDYELYNLKHETFIYILLVIE